MVAPEASRSTLPCAGRTGESDRGTRTRRTVQLYSGSTSSVAA